MKNIRKITILLLVFVLALCAVSCQCNDDSGEITETIKMSVSKTEIAVGETYTLTVETELTGEKVWTSSDTSVATVADGVVTAVEEGTARIFVTIGEEQSECVVTVVSSMTGASRLVLDVKTLDLFIGYEYTITAKLRNGTEETAVNVADVTWSVSSDVATVTNGIIKGQKKGSATITATYVNGQESVQSTITVNVDTISMLLLKADNSIVATTKTLAGADSVSSATKANITAELLTPASNGVDFNKSSIDASAVNWSSSDESVATVSSTGVVQSTQKAGEVVIKAEYQGAEKEIKISSYVAMQSKADFDLLALAYAVECADNPALTSVSAWASDKKYTLTGNIDYGGDYWIPIAQKTTFAASQIKALIPGTSVTNTIFKDGKTYNGLTAEEFKSINKVNTSDGSWCGYSFDGTINGNGYSISNAKILTDVLLAVCNNSTNDGNLIFSGSIFGFLGEDSLIENVAFKNFSVAHPINDLGYVQAATTYAALGGKTYNSTYYRGYGDGGFAFILLGSIKNVFAEIDMTLWQDGCQWWPQFISYVGSPWHGLKFEGTIENFVAKFNTHTSVTSTIGFTNRIYTGGLLDGLYIITNSTKQCVESNGIYPDASAFWTANQNYTDWTMLVSALPDV